MAVALRENRSGYDNPVRHFNLDISIWFYGVVVSFVYWGQLQLFGSGFYAARGNLDPGGPGDRIQHKAQVVFIQQRGMEIHAAPENAPRLAFFIGGGDASRADDPPGGAGPPLIGFR